MSDLLVSRASPTGVLTFTVFTPPGTVSGAAALAQRFVNLLLREYDANFDRGTNLYSNIRKGVLVNDATVRLYVALACDTVTKQITAGTDDTDTLSKYEITKATRSLGQLLIGLRLTTVSGAAAAVTVTGSF